MALEEHAKQLGTSLVDLVRSVAHHPETFRSAATFSASQRFTPSRHASLIRIAGGTQAAAAAAVADLDGSDPGSPASYTSTDAVPVAILDLEEDVGDAPTMQVEVRLLSQCTSPTVHAARCRAGGPERLGLWRGEWAADIRMRRGCCGVRRARVARCPAR